MCGPSNNPSIFVKRGGVAVEVVGIGLGLVCWLLCLTLLGMSHQICRGRHRLGCLLENCFLIWFLVRFPQIAPLVDIFFVRKEGLGLPEVFANVLRLSRCTCKKEPP